MDEQEKPRPPKANDPAPRDDVVVTQNRCPFCRDDVRGPTTEWVACAACLARHHEPCWGEGGGRCAACGHGERLRADSALAVKRRSWVKLAFVILSALVALVLVDVNHRISKERDEAERISAEMFSQALAQAEAAERERAKPRQVEERPIVTVDSRFTLARRVDELRRLNRSGSRQDARPGRKKAAWKQAQIDLLLARSKATPEEAARFTAAAEEIRRLDPPPSPDGPVESILQSQDEFIMPPRPEHPEFAAFAEKMRRMAQPGYAAHLLVVSGDPAAGLAEANRGLDRAVTDWLSWSARGEALLALGDHSGATMAFTLSESFADLDPTWALLGRVDLARARGDQKAELAAAWDALEVGNVPEWGGHLQALLERIATLEHELGER